jgi:rod shape-determining protein MreC
MGMGRPEGLARIADKLVLGVCVILSLWLLSLDEDTRVERAAGWAHRLTTPVEWAIHIVDGAVSLKQQNEELRARIAALELDARQIGLERERIEELEHRAGFYENSRGNLMPAVVLELVVTRFPVQAKIRTFGTDSLEIWQPVVTEKGLVGRVRQILGPGEALVQLLTDEDSRVSIESTNEGVRGLLRYDGRVFLMDQVPQGEPVEVGDQLVTSGLGGTVPPGLPVGEVKAVRASAAELFQHVEVEPAERFSALWKVYVIVRPGPWYSRAMDALLTEELSPSEAGDDSVLAEGNGR